jgi:hypothetical protein
MYPDAVGLATRIGNCFHRASSWLRIPVCWILSARCVRVCGRARILFDQSQHAAASNLSRRTRSTQLTWMMNPTLGCIYSIGDSQREHQQGGPGPTIGATHKVGNVMEVAQRKIARDVIQ